MHYIDDQQHDCLYLYIFRQNSRQEEEVPVYDLLNQCVIISCSPHVYIASMDFIIS